MSEAGLQAALKESVRDVLEKMFFADVLDPSLAEDGGEAIAAELIFEGDHPGSFWLRLDMRAAQSVAANFLGRDPDELTAEELGEVVCELANMICGAVLSRIESRAAFRLSKPRVVAAETTAGGAAAATLDASVGDGRLRTELRVERPVCPG